MTQSGLRDRSRLFAVLVVGAVTLWRAALLAFDSPLLSFDEAQYWAWAQTLQLGYYSKPPMVAWAIAATTALCGEGEGCIKAGSLVAHTGTAILLGLLGRRLFGPWVGAWSAVLWTTLPAVSLSAMMITTDPFLLFFWAAALLALVEAAEAGPGVNRWWVALGLCFGLGLLAKYAMVLFLLGLVLWLVTTPERRRLARGPGLWTAVVLGLLVYAPNALWNAANGFVSFKHTRDNAHLAGTLFHPGKLAEFAAGQFGVFGPLLFAGLLAAMVGAYRGRDGRERLLASFTVPLLAIMAVEALLSRANANWTAPAFVAGTVLVAAWGVHRAPLLLKASLALHLAGAAVLYDLDGVRRLAGLPDSAKYDPQKRIKGWDQVGARVSELLAERPGARLLADERKVIATLTYYVRPHPLDAVKWNGDGRIHDHFDQVSRLEPGPGEYVYVTEQDSEPTSLLNCFDGAERLPDIVVPVHADYGRRLMAWRLSGFRGYK
ncbi:MAG: ArnT family glycosyltransferase [Actinomycetota bacterium]